MHKIIHNHLAATINPLGAELCSLTKNGSELMWQGDDTVWGGRAPILFPIVGALKNGAMVFQDQKYLMPRHGIARHAMFEQTQQSPSSVSMQLKASKDSLSVYPWNFELTVHFALANEGLEIRYNVVNRDTSDMLFTIGSHPAFALEINDHYSFSDYDIAFDQPESFATFGLDHDGLLATTSRPLKPTLETTDNAIQLSEDIFNDDALVFRHIQSGTISLRRQGNTLLTVDTGGAPHLGLWAKPGAPFVCIEPWFGTSDFVDSTGDFAKKPDLLSLAPEQQFTHSLRIGLPGA